MMRFKMLTVIMFIFPVSAGLVGEITPTLNRAVRNLANPEYNRDKIALRVLVTEDQCGRSIDLTDIVKQELYLDYEGAELGDTLSNCVINITNYNVQDMICIKSEGTYLDFDCATLLKYYIGGWTSWSVYGKSYTCSEFYLTPLCDRNSVSSVVYRYTYLKTGSVKVKLFTKRYVATTTTRYTPTWSSSDFDDDDDDDSSNSVGTVVGISVGILVTVVILISCVCAKARGNSAPKPEYGPSPTTETDASAPTVEPSAPVVHYHHRNLDESHALNSADSYHPQPQSENAGNHTHNSTNQQVPNQDTQTGYQFDKPPPSYDSLPSALRVLVTEDQCGRSIDLTVEQELYLDYEGAELGDTLSNCVINITNYNVHNMICIKSEGTYLDFDCAMILRYYIGGWKNWSLYGKSYTCSDFYLRPLCDRKSVSSVVYRYTYLKTGSVKVKLFTKKYVATTTTRYTPTWSSWSSDYDDDDDGDSSNSLGTVIGIIVGIFVTFVILISCVCSKAGRNSAPKPEYGQPAVVQYHAQAPQGNQYAYQSHNVQNEATGTQQYPPNRPGFQLQQQYTPDPSAYAGYHVHEPVVQQVPVAGYGSDLPPKIQDPPPSDPPPPYPGY